MVIRKNKILQVGITGGIGSGKSVVCDIFKRLGIPVLNADDIAREICDINTAARKKLTALLGAEAYLPDGSLNRPFVASILFSEKQLRHKAETIIHPLVIKERKNRIIDLKSAGYSIVILETALLFETGLNKEVDIVVVVDAEEKVRLSRVCSRDAVAEESVRARMKAQLESRKKLNKADYVLKNNGTLEELEYKVRFLYNLFNRLSDERKND